MNHKFYSVNVSNSNIKRQELNLLSDFILEKELKEIYDTQYNDLFPKILSKTKSEFITLLEDQVLLHLKIINKKLLNSLNSKLLEYFSKKFFNEKNKVTKGLEEIIKNPELQENYLSLINCFIHCHKCSQILHKCKNKIILHKNYIYCLHCQKVYNENQIKLYCQECKTCYYTKLRHILNKRYENFFPVSFLEYHCNLEDQEKIKCLECGHDLYYNITYEDKNDKKNGIKEVFCLKCKLLYDLNEIYFKCKVCKSDFKSDAKLFISFSSLKIQFLLIMHCLRKKKYAIPEININRRCKCDITKYEKYIHQNDNGVLYLGHNLEGQYVIICDTCYSIFKYNEFLWNCPICGINFKSKKIMSEIINDRTMIEFWNIKNEKMEKKQIIFKSPSHMNIGKKKNIENYPTSAGLIKNNNNSVVNNLFKRDNTKLNINDNLSKSNHKTKIILLKNNSNSDKKQNLNSSDKKINLFKRINNINYKNNNNYNSVNCNYKEIDLRKKNCKNKNNNSLNSLLNNISFSNNKSESNTNKCTDSTANITYKKHEGVSEKLNDWNKIICRSPSCLLEYECNKKFLFDNNNKINRKLLYDDFIEKDKENKENKEYIKKSKTCMEKDKKDNKKDINNKMMKRIESIDSLKINNKGNKEKKILSENKKEAKISKLKENNKLKNILKDNNIKREKVEIKNINLSLVSNLINKDSFILDSKDNPKNMKTEFNSINYNNDKFVNSKKKIIKNIKSVKNITGDSFILDAKDIAKNMKTEFNSINYNDRNLSSKAIIKKIKNIKNIKIDNSALDSNAHIKNNKTELNSINNNHEKKINSKNKIKNIKCIKNVNIDCLNIDSKDNSKNIKTELNLIKNNKNNNNEKTNSKKKIKNVKSVRNIYADSFILDTKDNSKNIKTELNSINNNNDEKTNSKNKIKNIKNIKNINIINNKNNSQPKIIINNIKNEKNISNNCIKSIKSNIHSKEPIKIIEINNKNSKEKDKEEKKEISAKCKSQNKNKDNTKNNNDNKSNEKSNSVLDKIKKYYEDCINEDKNLLAKNNINRGQSQNKNKEINNSPINKVDFKTNFNSDNYKILKLLGKGTFGKTYLVEDIRTKERYALKKISINDKVELKENKEEYNLILKITKDYPDLKVINIYGIEIKNLDKYNTVMYVLMEAANCDWEKEIINRCKKRSFYKENELMLILTELVKTFAILQKNGISHRDVKPQNILCFGDSVYKISDFGEAKNLKKNFINKNLNYAYEDNTMKQTLRGTELYMSPILFHALRTRSYHFVKYNSYKSDVFSLGMCFFLASSLDYEGLYEVREITTYPKKTKFVVNRYLNMKYSQKYINLLISMLQINEKDRPDFIELEKMIEKEEN